MLIYLHLIKAPKALFGIEDNVLASIEFPFTVRNEETDKNKILRIFVASIKQPS